MTQADAAERLGLSVRQVERVYRAYKAGGAAALASKKRGRTCSISRAYTTTVFPGGSKHQCACGAAWLELDVPGGGGR